MEKVAQRSSFRSFQDPSDTALSSLPEHELILPWAEGWTGHLPKSLPLTLCVWVSPANLTLWLEAEFTVICQMKLSTFDRESMKCNKHRTSSCSCYKDTFQTIIIFEIWTLKNQNISEIICMKSHVFLFKGQFFIASFPMKITFQSSISQKWNYLLVRKNIPDRKWKLWKCLSSFSSSFDVIKILLNHTVLWILGKSK